MKTQRVFARQREPDHPYFKGFLAPKRLRIMDHIIRKLSRSMPTARGSAIWNTSPIVRMSLRYDHTRCCERALALSISVKRPVGRSTSSRR
jgi:hypothetical protein